MRAELAVRFSPRVASGKPRHGLTIEEVAEPTHIGIGALGPRATAYRGFSRITRMDADRAKGEKHTPEDPSISFCYAPLTPPPVREHPRVSAKIRVKPFDVGPTSEPSAKGNGFPRKQADHAETRGYCEEGK